MTKSSQPQNPQIYFLVSSRYQRIGSSQINLLKSYRFKYIDAGSLFAQISTKEDPAHFNQENFCRVGIRMIHEKIAKCGNQKYLIEGFPLDLETYQEFLKQAPANLTINRIIHLVPEGDQQRGLRTQADKQLKPLLDEAEKQSILKTLTFSHQSEQMTSYLLHFLKSQKIQVPVPVQVICILGGPGSGKGTNCANLVRDYGFKHISTGDLLRGYKEGDMLETIQKIMADGRLVPSDVLLEIVKEEIARTGYDGIYLLDGFPRNQENVDVWNQVMKGFAEIQFYLYLQCDELTMQKRLLGRSLGSGRSDDKPDVIKKRFKTFSDMTVSLIKDLIMQNPDKVITVDSREAPELVYAKIQQEFSNIGIQPVNTKSDGPSVIFILGGPGSGKGTQCEVLTRKYGFRHLSTGDLLRDQIKNKGPESVSIANYIAEGKLVPSTVLVKLLRNKMEQEGWCGKYLIDGFPRSIDNMHAWHTVMKNDVTIDSLLYFDCSIETMQARLLKRGETSGRSDDNIETIKKRFNTFKSETEPFLEFYEKSGCRIYRINSDQKVETVTKLVEEELTSQNLIISS